MEWAAQESGRVTISGSVQERTDCGTWLLSCCGSVQSKAGLAGPGALFQP